MRPVMKVPEDGHNTIPHSQVREEVLATKLDHNMSSLIRVCFQHDQCASNVISVVPV